MDLKKLAQLVSQCPPLWDRSLDKFRDPHFKAGAWNKLGAELNTTDTACREAFKSLREKYIREREKCQQPGNNYKPWELLDCLQFLDAHIITRNKGGSTNGTSFEQFVAIKEDPTTDAECNLQEEVDTGTYNILDFTTRNFCTKLIKMVHQSNALWDRNNKSYNDKQLKEHLWKTIANMLKSDATSCTLKWKSLREKYIRQKQKYYEGEHKWEFLDELSFLDNVILYRKKQWKPEEKSNIWCTSDNSCAQSQSNSDYEIMDDYNNSDSVSNQPNVTTSDVQKQTKPLLLPYTPDSSTLEIINNERKRTLSDSSETSCHKKRSIIDRRTPEQIFGELVAAMLANKTDHEKKLDMMEIMAILTRPTAQHS